MRLNKLLTSTCLAGSVLLASTAHATWPANSPWTQPVGQVGTLTFQKAARDLGNGNCGFSFPGTEGKVLEWDNAEKEFTMKNPLQSVNMNADAMGGVKISSSPFQVVGTLPDGSTTRHGVEKTEMVLPVAQATGDIWNRTAWGTAPTNGALLAWKHLPYKYSNANTIWNVQAVKIKPGPGFEYNEQVNYTFALKFTCFSDK